jgi:AcrR family transcriptional regulator
MIKPSRQTRTDARTCILDAADEIFIRGGMDGARMQEIADHAA